MKRSYWEKTASHYEDEIFDVLQNDKKGIIRSAIQKYASNKKTAIDIGCAVGKWLPILSKNFKKVMAIDISAENIKIAKKNNKKYKNISYQRLDMSSADNELPRCDLAICINALLTPDVKDRIQFLENTASCIRKKGVLILTVPSLESWLLSHILQQRFAIDKTSFPDTKNKTAALTQWKNMLQGNVAIDEVQHKHYLKEELKIVLAKAGFKVNTIKKIKYDWHTEFINPPKWLKNPQPWDWMAVVMKK